MAIYATDKSAMSRWKLLGPPRIVFSGVRIWPRQSRRAGFVTGIPIHEIEVAPGVKGLVAKASKRPLSAAREGGDTL